MSAPEPVTDRVTILTIEVIDKGDGEYDVEEYEEPIGMMAAAESEEPGVPSDPDPVSPPQPGQHHYTFKKSIPLNKLVDLLSVSGEIDTDAHTFSAEFKVLGFPIQQKPYGGNFDKGIAINIPKLKVATGTLNVNVNGKNVDLKYSILPVAAKTPYQGTITLYTLP